MGEERSSKSKRIQDYIRAHPQARNRDVVQALVEHGVTAADVSNAKALMKRKLHQPMLGPSLVSSPAGDAGEDSAAMTISVAEINSTIEFVQRVGGLTRAQQLLALVHQIQRMS